MPSSINPALNKDMKEAVVKSSCQTVKPAAAAAAAANELLQLLLATADGRALTSGAPPEVTMFS